MNKFLRILLLMLLPVAVNAKIFKAEEFTLDNGLRVVVVENHKAPLVKHMLWYQVGAVDEFRGRGGIAHLLEHLLFRGTDKVNGNEFNHIMEKNGADSNAFTSYDVTVYHQFADVSRLEVLMALEADRMQNLKISEKDFEAERKIVFQERKQVVENNPSAPFYEKMRMMMWGTSPYGQPITGLPEEITALKYGDTMDFYHKYYAPNNAILVLSGDIDTQTVRPLVEKYYGKLEKRAVKRDTSAPVTDNFRQTLQMRLPHIATPRVLRAFMLPPREKLNEAIYAYDILAELLGGGETAELYRDLVLKQRQAVSVSASYNYMTRSNTVFTVSMTPNTEKALSPDAATQVLNMALTKARKALTEERLAQIKRKISANMVYLNDNPQTAANWIGYMLSMGFELEDVQNYEQHINAVTLESVLQAFDSLQTASDMTAVLLPEKQTNGDSDAQ
ncbi:MAG: insulinase family protein [Alphaproteobacteria bacterium]|nr:insulinase family protein [Alphaproteobacteria bacterium]